MTRTLRNLLVVLMLCSSAPAVAASLSSTVTVATIAALQALGPASAQYQNVCVLNYATVGDGGGGCFVWRGSSTATAQVCTIFQATGVVTGRWFRVGAANGGGISPFRVDMCGTGNADDSAAFNAAFTLCAGGISPLILGNKHYRFTHNLTYVNGCWFEGQGTRDTLLDFTNDLDGGIALSMSGGTVGTYQSGPAFGGFSLEGNSSGVPGASHAVTGIYVSAYVSAYMHDVTVQYINGPCIIWGNTVASQMDRIAVTGCGSSTQGELEIYGESLAGTEYSGTTLSVYDLNAGNDFGAGTQCTVKVDRYAIVSFFGGTMEDAGIPLCVQTRASAVQGSYLITVTGMDLEHPTNGATHMVVAGANWTGTSGLAVQELVLNSNTFVGGVTSIDSFVQATNTLGTSASANAFQANNASPIVFEFLSSGNSQAVLGQQSVSLLTTPVYVKFNGTAVPGAQPNVPWSMSQDFPIPVASLVACSSDYTGQRRTVTDSNSTTFGATVANGGANIVPVGCNGTNWKIGY